jgi:hypothetical protein
MKSLLLLLGYVFIISCSKLSPITGIYQTKDERISANVIDSTLYLMFSADTAVIYNLQIHSQLQINDTTTFRIYNVVYSKSLNMNGYESFDIPIRFEYKLDFGGTLIASFINNDSFMLGGFYFYKSSQNEAKKIFKNWTNLLTNNTQTRSWMKYQNN